MLNSSTAVIFSSCLAFNWSPAIRHSVEPVLGVSVIGIIIHSIFWIQCIVCSSVRHRNMMWLYAYLICDMFLILRFIILYNTRQGSVCSSSIAQDILGYFEASSKPYINTIQSYLLLAFNICRYFQIVSNRNLYVKKPHLIVLVHLLIYVLPAVNLIVQFLANLTFITCIPGGSCDILYTSVIVQIFNLFLMYCIPVVLNIIILALAIRHVTSIQGILSQQIILIRRKRQRILLLQTLAFYSVWIILWSPDILAFQFTDINSNEALITTLLSYIEMALDPILIAIIDIRFLTVWRTLWKKMKRHRQIGIATWFSIISQHLRMKCMLKMNSKEEINKSFICLLLFFFVCVISLRKYIQCISQYFSSTPLNW